MTTLPVNQVTGRTPMPLVKKLNPLWWFGNHDEPTPPAWYMPGSPQWVLSLSACSECSH